MLLRPTVAGRARWAVVVGAHDEAGETKHSPSVELPWRGATASTVLPAAATAATTSTARCDAGIPLPHRPFHSFMPIQREKQNKPAAHQGGQTGQIRRKGAL